MKRILLLLLLILTTQAFSNTYTYNSILFSITYDLSLINSELKETTFQSGRIITDANAKDFLALYNYTLTESTFTTEVLSIVEDEFLNSTQTDDSTQTDGGNYYANYEQDNSGNTGSIKAIIYVFTLSGTPQIEYSASEQVVQNLSINDNDIDVSATVRFGETGSECTYSFVGNADDNTSTLRFSDCEVAISATNQDDGKTYSYTSQFSGLSQTFDRSSNSEDLTTVYIESDLINNSGEDVGNFRYYMNSQFLITDNNGNLL